MQYLGYITHVPMYSHLTYKKKMLQYLQCDNFTYAEISTAKTIDNKAFWMYQTTVKWKALQSLTHNLVLL